MTETENMLARRGMDLSPSLCFAALRGDDLLLHHLLRHGFDSNESDNGGRSALHIAASKGSENCVLLLLDYGANSNCRDSDGNVPVWEAMLGGHKAEVKLLVENGADINAGDVGHLACTAAEQNNLRLLEEIVLYGGDVICSRNNGTTALHVAVCEDNSEIVSFLLDHGADVDKPDAHGWTSRELADQQGHEGIQTIFRECKEPKPKAQPTVATPENQENRVHYLGWLACEPTIRTLPPDGSVPSDGSRNYPRPRRKTSNFHNSLFEMMSAAHKGGSGMLLSAGQAKDVGSKHAHPVRVTISCPEKGEAGGKLILLPKSFQELLDIGAKEFRMFSAKVFSKDRAEIDEIEMIRDGDHLIFETVGLQETSSEKSSASPVS